MPTKAALKKPVIPPPPVLESASAAVQKALGNALKKKPYVDDYAKASRSLGTLLAKDAAARQQLHAMVGELAHGLAALGKIEALGPKTRAAAFDRVDALEWMLTSLRCAGAENDAPLIALAAAVPDGPIRGRIADVLRGGQIALPASTDPGLAALFETSRDAVALRCAFGALWDRDENAARATATKILEEGDDEVRIVCVLDQLEHADKDHAAWTALVAPLSISDSRTISIHASNHFTRQRAAFHAFVAWVRSLTAPAEQRRALAVLAPNVYWAYVTTREIRDELVEPLRALRERAVAMKDTNGVNALDTAAKKSGIDLGVSRSAAAKTTKKKATKTTAKTTTKKRVRA